MNDYQLIDDLRTAYGIVETERRAALARGARATTRDCRESNEVTADKWSCVANTIQRAIDELTVIAPQAEG